MCIAIKVSERVAVELESDEELFSASMRNSVSQAAWHACADQVRLNTAKQSVVGGVLGTSPGCG